MTAQNDASRRERHAEGFGRARQRISVGLHQPNQPPMLLASALPEKSIRPKAEFFTATGLHVASGVRGESSFGLSHHGDLQRGHWRTSRMRGAHSWPQRWHVSIGIVTSIVGAP